MFDGTKYSYGYEPRTPTIPTLQWEIPLQGNQKDLRISTYNDTTGINSIYWRETLKSEIFDKGWLEVPTSTMTIQLNIISKSLKNFMIMTLTIVKLESGLYTVQFNTDTANMVMFDTEDKVM